MREERHHRKLMQERAAEVNTFPIDQRVGSRIILRAGFIVRIYPEPLTILAHTLTKNLNHRFLFKHSNLLKINSFHIYLDKEYS